ncbi:hypothetical protein AVEN_61120-1 [Araneus ventricosus]|uniref:Uncharacterized protein n=1 Tax=Araneus ventricosus TaxID=182803 RepID=A0A4Y2NYR7_ARAVE|nr:hypothetical protein AVEN_61120-1 [Araneus ventricosus]
MDWFFKGRFRNDPRHDIFDHNDQNFEDKDGHEGSRDSFDIPFIDPFENLEDTSMDLFRRMDDMLSRMFSASFDALEPENFSDQVPNESNPRAMMLKEPDCGSCDSSPVSI